MSHEKNKGRSDSRRCDGLIGGYDLVRNLVYLG